MPGEIDNPVLRSKDATASGGKANQSFSFTGHLLGAHKLLMVGGETDKQFMALSGYACRGEKQCMINYYLFIPPVDILVSPCVPSTGPRNREARDVVVVPSTPFQEKEMYEVSAMAGGRDTHSYTETQSWEGPLLQEGRSVYQQCYCTGKAVLQLSPENWMVFMQQDGIGKRLKVLETEAGREAQLCREGRNRLNSRAGTSHWSPTW